jgi:hypothetical protein
MRKEAAVNAIDTPITEWLEIIRGEYLELPGLHLTKSQMRRLWDLDPRTCDAIVEALVNTGFLTHTRADRYARAEFFGVEE